MPQPLCTTWRSSTWTVMQRLKAPSPLYKSQRRLDPTHPRWAPNRQRQTKTRTHPSLWSPQRVAQTVPLSWSKTPEWERESCKATRITDRCPQAAAWSCRITIAHPPELLVAAVQPAWGTRKQRRRSALRQCFLKNLQNPSRYPSH